MNNNVFLNYVLANNADMLTNGRSNGNIEEADKASKYFQRNFRMFTEMNRLDTKPKDWVFILMGDSNTAFFRDLIYRRPIYNLVNTFDYLKCKTSHNIKFVKN